MDIAQELIAMLLTPKRRAHAIEALREHGQPHKTDPARVTDGVALTLGRMKRWAQEDVLPRLDAGRTHAAPWAHEIAAHKVLPSDATSAVVLVTPEMRRVVLLVSDFVEAGRATAAQREGVGWFLGGETGGDEKGRHREALRRLFEKVLTDEPALLALVKGTRAQATGRGGGRNGNGDGIASYTIPVSAARHVDKLLSDDERLALSTPTAGVPDKRHAATLRQRRSRARRRLDSHRDRTSRRCDVTDENSWRTSAVGSQALDEGSHPSCGATQRMVANVDQGRPFWLDVEMSDDLLDLAT